MQEYRTKIGQFEDQKDKLFKAGREAQLREQKKSQ
jgi:hypothetical protein